MIAIEKARAKKKEHTTKRVIKAEHNLIKKAQAEPNSKAKAIAGFCMECMGGTEDELPDPGWKDLIRTCASLKCPLNGHRPYRGVRGRA